MTTSFDNLIHDISTLWSSNKTPQKEDLDEFADNIKEAVVTSLNRKEESKDTLRMSAIGKPDRQLWFDHRYKTTEDFSYSTLLKFLYGSIIEELLVLLIKTAGHKVTEQQKVHSISNIKGHSDGRVDGVLVDFKSASNRAFNKFKNAELFYDDPFGYIAQISAYAKTDGDERAAFVVLNKESGEVTTLRVDKNRMIDPVNRINYLKEMIEKDEPPSLCYSDQEDGKSGNRKLSIGCSYCNYKKKCWPHLRAFKYSNGVRYMTVVEREPNVEEVFIAD